VCVCASAEWYRILYYYYYYYYTQALDRAYRGSGRRVYRVVCPAFGSCTCVLLFRCTVHTTLQLLLLLRPYSRPFRDRVVLWSRDDRTIFYYDDENIVVLLLAVITCLNYYTARTPNDTPSPRRSRRGRLERFTAHNTLFYNSIIIVAAVLPVFCRVFPFWLDRKSIYACTLNYKTIDFTFFHFLILDIFSYVGKYQKTGERFHKCLKVNAISIRCLYSSLCMFTSKICPK